MPQIINETNWGAQLGEGLGKGIHEALDYLAYKKLNDLTESKQRRSAEGALTAKGYTPEEARSLSGLKGPELAAAIKTSPGRAATPEWINSQRQAQGLPPLDTGSFSQGMNALNQGTSQPKPLIPANLQQQTAPNQKQAEAAAIFPKNDEQQLLNAAKQFANPLAIQEAQLARTGTPKRLKPQEIKEAAKAIDEAVNQKPQTTTPAEQLAPQAPVRNLTTLDKYAGMTRKEIEEAIKSEQEQKRYQHAETKEYEKELSAKAKASKERIEDIEELERLDEEGVDSAGFNEFLNRSGYDIAALRNPNSQLHNKIIQDQVKDAKAEYGTRLTDADLTQFFKRWGDLSNSKAGRKKIYAYKKWRENGNVARKQVQKHIKAENGGSNPLDIDDLVEERVQPMLDKLTAKFKKEVLEPVIGETSSPLSTAAGAVAGDVVKNAGKLAKTAAGAYAGYKAGRLFPHPAGGPAGGILGALGGLTGLY